MISVAVAIGIERVGIATEDMVKFISMHLWSLANDVDAAGLAEVNFAIDMNLLRFVVLQSNMSDERAVSYKMKTKRSLAVRSVVYWSRDRSETAD